MKCWWKLGKTHNKGAFEHVAIICIIQCLMGVLILAPNCIILKMYLAFCYSCIYIHKYIYIFSNLTSTSRSLRKATDEVMDEPLSFSKSEANNWDALHSFAPPRRDAPWYEKWMVLFSTGAFLIYFCLLREENDMDRQLEESLYTRIPGLEEKSLIQCIRYNEEKGLSTKDFEARLKEIEEEKKGMTE